MARVTHLNVANCWTRRTSGRISGGLGSNFLVGIRGKRHTVFVQLPLDRQMGGVERIRAGPRIWHWLDGVVEFEFD